MSVKSPSRLLTTLLVAALVFVLAWPRVASTQAPSLLFGSFSGAMKAVQVDSAGRLKISLGAGVIPVANGGTGLATLTANNVILGNGTSPVLFVAPGTSGNVLTSNGTTWTSAAASAGAPGGATNTVQYNAGSSTFGGVALNATATKMYLQQVSSGVATFAQVAIADLSGFAANVATWLATPSSANLAAALTDETGSGAAVFATSPTFVTPLLGTPTSGVLTNATGYTGVNLVLTDVTTNNASTSAHGFAPKYPNDATKYLDGTGAYTVPAASTTGGTWTPADASGAGLSLTITTATYLVVGSLVCVQTDLSYPSTVSGASAAISGLPFTAAAARWSLSTGFTNSPTAFNIFVNTSTQNILFFASAGGAAITNATLSLTTNRLGGCYSK